MSERACPNCGTVERRWLEHGREQVNLSPLTGQCVDCLVAMTRELRPAPRRPSEPFDSRAAAARNDT